VIGAVLAGAPQVTAVTGPLPKTEESCNGPSSGAFWPGKPNRTQDTCRDFIGDITLEPIDGGLRVSWAPGKDSTVRWDSCTGDTGAYADCPIERQTVFASDPSSTGARTGQTCVPNKVEDRSCVITGLRNGAQYAIRIRTDPLGARTEPLNGTWGYYSFESPATPFTASPCCSVPQPPSAVAATPVGGALDVTWAQPTDWGGAEELTYRVSTTPESSTCEVTVLACRLENVPRGVPVTVKVTASNASHTSVAAASAPVSTPVTAPDPPRVVTAKYPEPGTARVTWTAPVNDGGTPVTGYAATATPSGKTCTTSGARACTITGLSGGRKYSFTVRATNSVGTSVISPAGVAGLLVNPASAPRDVKASVAGGTATVSWSKPARSGGGKLVQYVVSAGSSTCTTKKTSCTVSGLALGRSYLVTITAVTTGGRSKPATTSVTTIAPVPVAPDKGLAPIT
jgi:hypothetical protein